MKDKHKVYFKFSFQKGLVLEHRYHYCGLTYYRRYIVSDMWGGKNDND